MKFKRKSNKYKYLDNDSGVYRITNLLNGKSYLGSSKKLRRRMNNHFSRLRNQDHPNTILQSSFNKYGEDNLEFEVIEYCKPKFTLILEQWYLDNSDCEYNLKQDAFGGSGLRKDVRFFKNEDDVLEIVELVLSGFTQTEIAESYGCSKTIITSIIKGYCYQDIITEELRQKLDKFLSCCKNKYGRKLTCKQALEIKKLHKSKEHTQKEIGKLYNVSESTIIDIIKERSYKECK